MVALQILVLPVQVRVLISQQNPCKSLQNNKIQKSLLKNGTETGQLPHSAGNLYEALSELCERKKMYFFKPIAYKDYTPARLTEGESWFISFYVKSPLTGKLRRQRIKFNRIASVRERRKRALQLVASINENLALGWNPLAERLAPKASASIGEAARKFIKAKTKEVESGSVRTYLSFIRILFSWLKRNGIPESASVCSITRDTAARFMSDIESGKDLIPRTYNNYIRFYSILFRWLVEHGYVQEDPFAAIKTKKIKRRSKKRRVLTGAEVARLVEWLSANNTGFLRVCLLCYCCLMRPKEIMLLKCSDIDLEGQLVKVSAAIAKNDHDSVRTIPDAMMPYFRGLDLSHGDWYLFSGNRFEPGRKKVWTQRASDYWRDSVRPALGFGDDVQLYSLKDTGITNMAAAGVPVSFIRQQADHSSLEMTSIYCQGSEKASAALKAVDIID